MVEDPPQVKNDEQYPLLMVASNGDGVRGTSTVSSALNVTSCNPKQSWKVRWPEFLSACWMTLVIFGISFLVFYVIGMIACRQQAFIFVKYNSSKPPADVFYHQFIQNGNDVPFAFYADYLSDMAKQYPSLKFNVYFFVDDPFRNLPTSKLIPLRVTYFYEANNKVAIKLFQKQHENVNITIMPLSKFMAETPLKHKWHNIPISYLQFYVKVFSVWQNGGIAIDLRTYNYQFQNRNSDERLTELLSHFNNGKKTGSYEPSIPTKQRNEENEILSFYNNFLKDLVRESLSFFNKSLPFYDSVEEKLTPKEAMVPTVVRTHRNKRSISSEETRIDSNNTNQPLYITNTTSKNNNSIGNNVNNTGFKISQINELGNNTNIALSNNTKTELLTKLENNEVMGVNISGSQGPSASLICYDVLVYTNYGGNGGNLFPGLIFNQMMADANIMPKRQEAKPQDFNRLVTLDFDGLFVAAAVKGHPFLGHLLTDRCRRIHPKCAVQEILFSRCNSLVKENSYCDTIRVI